MAKETWTPEKSEAKIWRMLEEITASQKRRDAALDKLAATTAAAQKRTDAKIEKLVVANAAIAAERKKEAAAIAAERKKEAAERKKKWEVIFEDLAESGRRVDRRIDEVDRQLGGIGQNLGGLAEDFFYANAPKALEKSGFQMEYYDRNVFYNEKGILQNREYDIIGVNGDCVVVIEVKSRLQKKHVKEFVKILPHFIKDFPEHKGKKIYGGVAGMSLDFRRAEKGSIEKIVEEQGLFLLTQTDSDAAELHKPGKDLAGLKNFG